MLRGGAMRSSIMIVFSLLAALLGWNVGNAEHPQLHEDSNEGFVYSLNKKHFNPLESPIFDIRTSTAVGSYTNGSLQNSIRIRDEGKGFVKIFRNNRSNYGTDHLINAIEYVTSEMKYRYPNHPKLEITALSKRYGGHSPGHDSHQNGLDMDAIYLQRQGFKRDSSRLNSSDPHSEEKFVQEGRVSDSLDFARNFHLMHLFVQTGQVHTIFTDRTIKTALCQYAGRDKVPGFENTLAKMKHWKSHDTHFHVRLRCPQSSKGCVEPTPPSDTDIGCTLDMPPAFKRSNSKRMLPN